FVEGNPRIDRQFEFVERSIPPTAKTVLVLRCGCGEVAHFIASRVPTVRKVLGVDISSNYIKIAKELYPHPRVRYRRLDLTIADLPGTWDVIILPDVYEHIPLAARPSLHGKI